jgi:alpha-beta hydrolase superfamily lysophospholipase
MNAWPRTLALVAAVTLVVTGCSSSKHQSVPPIPAAQLPPAPTGDVYRPPNPLPADRPGTLIWAAQVNGLPIQPTSRVWRILYHSRTRTGRDVAVSGIAIVPTSAAPKGGREIYAWGHGTVGQGDRCAPSKDILANLPPYGGEQLERGGVVVATDYDGLGTPGTPTYLDSVAEGRAMLDSVRAVAALPGVGSPGPVVLAGHSQGGTAALFAAQIAASYAPELKVQATIAVAPGSELVDQASFLRRSPYAGFALLVADGLRAAYGLDPRTFLTADAVADLPRVERECSDATVKRWQGRDPTIALPVSAIDPLAKLLTANSPGHAAIPTPVLLVTAGEDQQLPGDLADRLESRYCALGTAVDRDNYPSSDHDSVLDTSHADVIAWITDRLAGGPDPAACAAGGSAGPSSPAPASSSAASSSAPSGVTGTWSGTWTSTKFTATSGDFTVVFAQHGATLTGRITIHPSCIPTGTLSGTMSGTVIDFGAVHGSSRTVRFTGAVHGNTMAGRYQSDAGCGLDRGTWQAHR